MINKSVVREPLTSTKIEVNGIAYHSMVDAYTALNLPRNLLGSMIKAGKIANDNWNIISLRLINDAP